MKLICLSDTHLRIDLRELLSPFNDQQAICIHGGDALNSGSKKDWVEFNEQLKAVRPLFKRFIYVPGNHDRYCESNPLIAEQDCLDAGVDLLVDRHIEIDKYKFFGSPFSPRFYSWSYMSERGTARWNQIRQGTDIVITHGPAYGRVDQLESGESVGCEALAARLSEIDPLVHISGHIHSAYGHVKYENTDYYNVSICREDYKPLNAVTVIELSDRD
jgi:Icc-related predicted phosphoesterase